MKRLSIALAAILCLLCFAPQAHADAAFYYQNDPGYGAAFRSEAAGGFAIIFVYASVMILLGRVCMRSENSASRVLAALVMVGATYVLFAAQTTRSENSGSQFLAGDRPPESPANKAKGIRTAPWGKMNPNDEYAFPGPVLIGGCLAVGAVLGGVLAIRYRRRPKASENRPVIREPDEA